MRIRKRNRVHIRWMLRADLDAVLAIERASFEYPWGPGDFAEAFCRRNVIGMAYEHAERVVGYMVYALHKRRLELLNFAVDEGARRLGVGTAMVAKLKSKLSEGRRTAITLEVRETNLPAQLFFRRQGFRVPKQRGILKNYYDETDEDAYRFVYRLAASAETIAAGNRISRLRGGSS